MKSIHLCIQQWSKRFLQIATISSVCTLFHCLDRPVVSIEPLRTGSVGQPLRFTQANKVDLLLVIDNSSSMADKQLELSKRMPELIWKLTNGITNNEGLPLITDIHVGVISSSLGSYGTRACDATTSNNPGMNDRGHLLPRANDVDALNSSRNGWKTKSDSTPPEPKQLCPTLKAASGISWVFNPNAAEPKPQFKNQSGADDLQVATSCVVSSVGETGCGFEAPLESMYHFLIDPKPYLKAEAKCEIKNGAEDCGNIEISNEIDKELLAQRKDFLRTDSVLAIVVLSDENDVSIRPSTFHWAPTVMKFSSLQNAPSGLNPAFPNNHLLKGWDTCANIPDSEESEDADFLRRQYNCTWCFLDANNPNCSKTWAANNTMNEDTDAINVRGFNQIQRFGYNFLYSTQRYINGLTQQHVAATVVDPTNPQNNAPNPIFIETLGNREETIRMPESVVFAAIVGVPKQLVGESRGDQYMIKNQLTELEWSRILGPSNVRDPHMIESIAPRKGIATYLKNNSPIETNTTFNGGERDIQAGDDLQFACIERRAYQTSSSCESVPDAMKSKSKECLPKTFDCEINPGNNPLCNTTDQTQPYFKAYPGLRALRVVKALGKQGLATSICNTTYSPAVAAIQSSVKDALINSQCIQSQLEPDNTGNVNCLVLEIFSSETPEQKTRCEDIGDATNSAYCTPGSEPCRRKGDTQFPPVSIAAVADSIRLPLRITNADDTARRENTQAFVENGNVYLQNENDIKKTKHLVCEVKQLAGGRVSEEQMHACQSDSNSDSTLQSHGWCYSKNISACKSTGSTLRFLGNARPKNGSELFTICNK